MTHSRKPLVTVFEIRSLALIASWTLAGAALAQGTAPTPAPATEDTNANTLFRQADRNGDGQISREEAAAVQGLSEVFDQLDSDRSGGLSPEEFARGLKG